MESHWWSYFIVSTRNIRADAELIFGDIDQWLVYRPVLDEVRRPLPVVSTSNTVGGDPVTLLSLLVGKGAKTDLIEAVAAFVDFDQRIAFTICGGRNSWLGEAEPGEERTEINFGWSKNKDNIKDEVIEELQQQMDEESCTKAGAQELPGLKIQKKDAKADQPKKPKVPLKTKLSLKFVVSVPSITTPILDDSEMSNDLPPRQARGFSICFIGDLSASIYAIHHRPDHPRTGST